MTLLKRGLKEDGLPWDWTVLGCGLAQFGADSIRAQLTSKSSGVWAGSGLLECLTQWVQVDTRVLDGDRIEPGQIVFEVTGRPDFVFGLERTVINLASYVSGIATMTRKCVDAVQRASQERGLTRAPRVTGTRKYLPGYRDVAIHGLCVGGGHPHRMALNAGVLIKENHIAAAGGIARAVAEARENAPHSFRIEVEVQNIPELTEAVEAGAEVVMLDNFSPRDVETALKHIAPKRNDVWIEVSGGIRFENIGEYVLEGVDVISVGALTHSVQSVDLSLTVVA